MPAAHPSWRRPPFWPGCAGLSALLPACAAPSAVCDLAHRLRRHSPALARPGPPRPLPMRWSSQPGAVAQLHAGAGGRPEALRAGHSRSARPCRSWRPRDGQGLLDVVCLQSPLFHRLVSACSPDPAAGGYAPRAHLHAARCVRVPRVRIAERRTAGCACASGPERLADVPLPPCAPRASSPSACSLWRPGRTGRSRRSGCWKATKTARRACACGPGFQVAQRARSAAPATAMLAVYGPEPREEAP